MIQAKNETGAMIDAGAQNWQVFQQDKAGVATITLKGRWRIDGDFKKIIVIARVVLESEMYPVSRSLDWQTAETHKDGTWTITLAQVPQGGLYRIETALQVDDARVEWATRGDMVHHVAVGDIWVIAGQSNSAGYGKSPAHDGPELGIHMFHASGEWRLATHPLGDSTGTQYPMNREGANASHSPYLAFARRLKQALGCPIGLIPAALGGSPMSGWTRKMDGCLFENMLAYVRDAGGTCRGMAWYQGESDTGPSDREAYHERFADMVTEFRRELADSHLPVITVQLNRHIGEPVDGPSQEGWEIMRDIQRCIPKHITDVAVISTLDVGLSDGIHNNSAANLVIGKRMADAALATAYGQDVKWRCPDCQTAQLVDAQTIELVFADVDTRLNYESAVKEQFPFAVRDSGGVVPIQGWEMTGKDTLSLKLERSLIGTATVIGAPTANPSPVVPVDIAGFLPMLAFRVEVTAVV